MKDFRKENDNGVKILEDIKDEMETKKLVGNPWSCSQHPSTDCEWHDSYGE